MIIYIDIIFFQHLIINYFLLCATEKILKLSSSFLKRLIASIIATVYSLVTIIYHVQFLNSLICKLLLAVLVVYIAFKFVDIGNLIKSVMVFYSATYFLGGIATSILSKIINECFCIVVSMGAFVFLCVVMMKVLARSNFICNVEIRVNEEVIVAKALLDTGHDLQDAITGETVLILSEKKIKEMSEKLYLILKGKMLDISKEYETKIRMVTYSSLGNENGIMYGIKVDSVIAYYDGKAFENKNVIVALAEKDFKKFDAIIGLNLIEEGVVYGNSFAIKIKS